jgi:hypothetical protein
MIPLTGYRLLINGWLHLVELRAALVRPIGALPITGAAGLGRSFIIASEPDWLTVLAAPTDARPGMAAGLALEGDVCMLQHFGHLG